MKLMDEKTLQSFNVINQKQTNKKEQKPKFIHFDWGSLGTNKLPKRKN